jgi:hypothetical protein
MPTMEGPHLARMGWPCCGESGWHPWLEVDRPVDSPDFQRQLGAMIYGNQGGLHGRASVIRMSSRSRRMIYIVDWQRGVH